MEPEAIAVRRSTSPVSPVLVLGNPSCEDYGLRGIRFNDPVPGTYDVQHDGETLFSVTFSIDAATSVLDWSATGAYVSAVIAKGGPNASVYSYDPPASSGSVITPTNPNNDTPYGWSHVDFCYSDDVITLLGLNVTKTAVTSYTRTWDWSVTKSSTISSLILSVGQTFDVAYDVTVNAEPIITARTIAGVITAVNTDPLGSGKAITIKSVTDEVFGGEFASVDCGVPLPYDLEAEGELSCAYTLTAAEPPETGTNVAQIAAELGSVTNNFEAEADWNFADAVVTEVDEAITLTDSQYGDLGTVMASEAPRTFTYTLEIGPYAACGDYTFDNTATFTTNNSGTSESDRHRVAVSVPCNGCTLTQGYWKTHSTYGPARADDGWDAVGGPDATFYLSGQSWYTVFHTAPAGNAYYNLAHQYMAATLNPRNGASSTAAVDAALSGAKTFFNAKTPAQTSTLTRAQRTQLLAWATTLDRYNNGLIGPGHCSEQ
jgi:hypothetical protein